jgi:hypothetical protein
MEARGHAGTHTIPLHASSYDVALDQDKPTPLHTHTTDNAAESSQGCHQFDVMAVDTKCMYDVL